MKYRSFGRRTGLRVSELSLGTGNFGTGWGHGADREESKRIFDGYVAAGGNFLDTADGYQGGQSEELVGEFIHSDRDNFVLATKYSMGFQGGVSRTGNSRKNMVRSLEDSLKRLKTDYVDLYWLHMADNLTPTEEILRAFDDLVRSGKILYAGLSNFPAWRVARADLMAELQGWAPIAGIEIEYSLVERTADRELLPMVEALGLGTALWSPLGGGVLTGKYRQGEQGRAQGLGILIRNEKTARDTAIVDELLAVAGELGVTPTRTAIAWLLHKAARSSTGIIPILGPRTLAQLEEPLKALEQTIPAELLARLDAVSAPSLGVPHEQIRDFYPQVAGGKPELLVPATVGVA